MTKLPKLLEDCDPEHVAKADPLYVDIVTVVQDLHPMAFQGDMDDTFKAIFAVTSVLATLFASFRVHQTTERKTLLEVERKTLDHVIELAELYEAGAEIARGDAAMTESCRAVR